MTTRTRKICLMAATGLSVAMIGMPALAQDNASSTSEPTAAEKAATAKAEAGSDEVIIVRGVRGSMKDSADKKRKSKQISDSVSAEDAGKLPDNNVTEALAHVTGVQITRKHGEGSDMAIRGIQEVGTTINGNAVGGGNMRSLNHNAENGAICTTAINFGQCQDQGPTLADVPAALIKSVTVYKTRSADQVEGGIAGVVNVDLRRPLDLKKGFTFAGSYRDSYSSIGDTESPTASFLVADRFDTPIGEMGWLVNLGYSKNRYQEQHLVTETVRGFYGYGLIDGQQAQYYNPTLYGDAALTPNYITAYRVWNGLQQGTNSRPTANLGYQWRINDNLDVVAEASWLGSREQGENDYMSVITGEYWGTNGSYDDIVTAEDGQTLKSFTINAPSGVPFNMYASYWENKSDTYTTNLEAHYRKDKLTINGSIQYNWTNLTSNNISQILSVKNLTSVGVDFDNAGANGVLIQLPEGILDDLSNYTFTQFHNEVSNSNSRDFNGQVDVTYDLSDDWFIRSIQTGFRVTSHFTNNYYAYRDAYINQSLSSMPLADSMIYTSLGNDAFSSSGFYHLSNQAILNNWSSFISYLNDNDQWGENWSTTVPTDTDNNSYSEKEFTRAWYGQINYAFNAFYPIDGQIGVRDIATEGQSTSTWIRGAYTTASGAAVAESRGSVTAPGKYNDVLPNVNGTIHFTPKFQLRLSYDYSVQRPAFSQLASGVHLTLDANGTATSGWGGNPDLKPMRGPNYDASLEYYFGRGGVLSFAAYLKKPKNQFFYAGTNMTLPDQGITSPIYYYTYYNAGQGTYQGYEFNAQGFFDFLPGIWKNFGAGFNYTYNQIYKLQYPNDLTDLSAGYYAADGAWTSKNTYNIQLFYDTPRFNARVAYNFRSKYMSDINIDFPEYTYTNDNTSRLDVSLAYTPVKWMTFTVEGTNLGNNNQLGYYGYKYFPAETRLQARTIQFGVRFRN